MDTFDICHAINDLLLSGNERDARLELIKLLDGLHKREVLFSPLVNCLIRQTGLYPYLEEGTSLLPERIVFQAFKADTGDEDAMTLHREQSSLLKSLLDGESIAVSAPTSFGKSFVIDAYIAIKRPKNVVIIVPTLALTDETRRRIYKKFGEEYKIITTSDASIEEKNIFIFPQERAINYLDKIDELDLLVVDEFYKASSRYDKDRSPSLVKILLKFGSIAKQRYFLAPNISDLEESVFTRGMVFHNKLDFNTVYLQIIECFKEIRNDELKKSRMLVNTLEKNRGKTLIYAASHPQIEAVAQLLISDTPVVHRQLLRAFEEWLAKNYDPNWKLTKLVSRGAGIHNGSLHRSLSQIQIKLFEETRGLDRIVSTSSIIEGVNTSAENIVLWKNRKGRGTARLDDFTYKNIIGRGGRMFKHFVGKVFLLEEPPKQEETRLDIDFPDSILGDIDEVEYSQSLTQEQIYKIISFREELISEIGQEPYRRLFKEGEFHTSNSEFLKRVALDVVRDPSYWNGFAYLNSNDPAQWSSCLYKVLKLQPGNWDGPHTPLVEFVKILSLNWHYSIPTLLRMLDSHDIGIDMFFKLEKTATFKLAALLHDLNQIQIELIGPQMSVSSFIGKLANAFLPPPVYQLEEYGLPRMISRKLHDAYLIRFGDEDLPLDDAVSRLKIIGEEAVLGAPNLDDFDKYILRYFFDGIKTPRKKSRSNPMK